MAIQPGTVLNPDSSEYFEYNHPDFPAFVKKIPLSSYPNFSAVSHWHNDPEILLIEEGEMFYDVNGQKIPLHTGEGLFVNSRSLHYGYSESMKECYFICILVPPQLLSGNTYFIEHCLNPLIQNTGFPYQKLNPSVRWQNSILQDLEKLYETNADEIQPFIVLEKMARIFRLLSENMHFLPDFDKNTEDISILTAMIGYVQQNYAEKILLKDIFSAGNCCKTKCTLLFRKYLDTSPMVYLNRYRLDRSALLLRDTAMPVSDIAYACGFPSNSYYCELFHKYYNTTPGKFRNRIK